MSQLFPDIPVSLLATCSTQGPIDLAAELKAAGMLAASWQVEEMDEQLADLQQSYDDMSNNFDSAIVQANQLAESADEIDEALLNAMGKADEVLEAVDLTPEDKRDIRAVLDLFEATRDKIQRLSAAALDIKDTDESSKPAARADHWAKEAPKPEPKKRRRKAA